MIEIPNGLYVLADTIGIIALALAGVGLAYLVACKWVRNGVRSFEIQAQRYDQARRDRQQLRTVATFELAEHLERHGYKEEALYFRVEAIGQATDLANELSRPRGDGGAA